MQANDRVLARRYAKALYQSANKQQRDTAQELGKITRRLAGKMSAYSHPRISAKDKKELLRRELGEGFGEKTMRFLNLLIEKKRFALLPHIALVFGGLCDEGEGVVHAKVQASHELTNAERAELAKKLSARVGKTVNLNVKVEPGLLAGVIVRIGDWVFDASLKGELERMRGRLSAQN